MNSQQTIIEGNRAVIINQQGEGNVWRTYTSTPATASKTLISQCSDGRAKRLRALVGGRLACWPANRRPARSPLRGLADWASTQTKGAKQWQCNMKSRSNTSTPTHANREKMAAMAGGTVAACVSLPILAVSLAPKRLQRFVEIRNCRGVTASQCAVVVVTAPPDSPSHTSTGA